MVSSSGLFSVSSSELISMSSVITTPLAFKVASSVHLVSGSHVYSWTRGTKLRSVYHILKAHLFREVNVLNLLFLIKYDVNFIFKSSIVEHVFHVDLVLPLHYHFDIFFFQPVKEFLFL